MKSLTKSTSHLISALRNRAISLIVWIFTNRKKIIISSLILIFLIMIASLSFTAYIYIKYRPLIYSILDKDYTYKFERVVKARLAAPVRVKMPIEQEVEFPFKHDLRIKFPFKDVLSIPLKHKFKIDLDEPITILIDHTFPINETVHLNTVFPIDTKTSVNIFGIKKDIGIKGNIPVDYHVPIKHDFHYQDKISFISPEPIIIPIDNVFDIPLDIVLDVNLPIDMSLKVPLKIDFDTEFFLEQKIPVLIEFDISFNPLKGIEITQ